MKANKIIVIGLDNAGKSTLVNQLKEKLGWEVVKSLGKDASKDEMAKYLLSYFNKQEDKYIFERFSLFEEMVYGKVLRGESKFSFKSPVYKTLIQNQPMIIYCKPSMKAIMKSFDEREQLEGVKDNIKVLSKRYGKVFRKMRRDLKNVYVYNYEKDNIDNLMKWVNDEGMNINNSGSSQESQSN